MDPRTHTNTHYIMKKIYSALLLAALSVAGAHAEYVTSGNNTNYTFATLAAIEGSGVVSDGTTYSVTDNITISEGDILTIEPGKSIILYNGVKITIDGEARMNPEATTVIEPLNSETRPLGWQISGKATLKNLVMRGGGIKYLGTEPLMVEQCTFENINNELNNFGVIVLSGYSSGSRIANCVFRDCEVGAVNTPANLGVGLTIENNLMQNLTTVDQARPYINVTSAPEEVVTIAGNHLLGADLAKPGGIGVSNMLNTPGENKVIISNNTVEHCSWGVNLVGGMTVQMLDNRVLNNNADPDDNGGFGVSIYSLATLPMDVYAQGNTFDGNKWGVWVLGGSTANFGCTDANNGAVNPGMNRFYNNSFVNTSGANVHWDLCNYTANTVYAQGNFWNDAATAEQVGATIQDKRTNSSYGEVVFTPFNTPDAVKNVATPQLSALVHGSSLVSMMPADMTVYNAQGVSVMAARDCTELDLGSLPAGIYVATVRIGAQTYTVKIAR